MSPVPPLGVFVGAATLDLHYLVERFPAPDSKGPAAGFGVYAGGPAANAAVTFAHLGGRAVLYTELGGHPLGKAAAADLAACRVELADMAAGSAGPPMVSAVVTTAATGERMVVASHYPDDGAAPGLPGLLPAGATVLLVDGFLGAAALDAAGQAAGRGIPVVLDGGSWKPAMAGLLPLVDHAVCSADFRPPGTGSTDEVLGFLEDRGVAGAAVTAGGRPVRYRWNGRSGEVPVQEVDVVDTLGAGDVFHGAFCFRIAAGDTFPDALAAAAAAATRSVRSFGTRAWMGEPGGTH